MVRNVPQKCVLVVCELLTLTGAYIVLCWASLCQIEVLPRRLMINCMLPLGARRVQGHVVELFRLNKASKMKLCSCGSARENAAQRSNDEVLSFYVRVGAILLLSFGGFSRAWEFVFPHQKF